MAGGIGSPVTPSVAEQITARQKVIQKKVGRTSEDLLYMNSKTGWIKLSSSVNTITLEEQAKLNVYPGIKGILGDNTKAGTNILLGGVLAPDRGLRKGIDTTGVYNQNAAYNNRMDSTGIRPMPGITSMNVKSKNTYGTLREAEVKFMCWTLEDFELMEELYLRPGYTVLLEWGHSMYINNSGTLQKDIETIGTEFFNSNISMCQLTSEIAAIRKATDNNYEGMIGYIKNFSWSYTPDGGYDSSVSIISTGEILESMQLRFDPAQRVSDLTLFDPINTDTGKEQRKSIYHAVISLLAPIANESFGTPTIKRALGDLGINLLPDHRAYYQRFQIDHWYWDKEAPTIFISLRLFFDIFNTLITPVDTSKGQGTCGRTLTQFNTDYGKSSKFLTSPEHFSIAPTLCALLYAAQFENGKTLQIDNIQTGIKPPGDENDVLNIYISLPYLKKTLDNALDESGKINKSMHDVTEIILEDINTALGGINDLGLAYDDEDNGGTWYVIDRNNTPETSPDLPVLTLAGIDSVFTDVGIASKISNEIGSQISIAAQGGSAGTTDNVDNIINWNVGVIDRVKPIKTTIDKGETPQELEDKAEAAQTAKRELAERTSDWIDTVIDVFADLNSTDGYDEEDMESIKTLHA